MTELLEMQEPSPHRYGWHWTCWALVHVVLTHEADQALPTPQGPWEPHYRGSQRRTRAHVQTGGTIS